MLIIKYQFFNKKRILKSLLISINQELNNKTTYKENLHHNK